MIFYVVPRYRILHKYKGMYFSYQERKMFDMSKQKRIYVTGINVLKMIFISLIYYLYNLAFPRLGQEAKFYIE